MNGNIIISLRSVKKIYQMDEVKVAALNGVTLDIKRGEFLAIIGKSGSGKSTLVNQIGCIDTPTSGRVFLDGEDISEMTEDELARVRGRKIGFIFQSFNLMPTLTVHENVALPLMFQGISREIVKDRVDSLLKLVDLSNRKHHKPSELSGGQRQRVAIARALANNPDVILADEPTGNLDSKTGKQIMRFLVKLNMEKGVTIVLVTHEKELSELAERVVTLSDGKIIEEKTNSKDVRNKAFERIGYMIAKEGYA